MPLGAFAPGAYSATFNTAGNLTEGVPAGATAGARDLGLVEGVRNLSRSVEGRDVRGDLYGDAVIDGVYRGGQCFVSMIFKEWTIAVQDALWPYGGDSGDFGRIGTVGQLNTNMAGILILTAQSGSPAAGVIDANVVGSATFTFHSAIISPGHSFDVPLGTDERNVPIVFRCYPSDESGTVRWFTTT